MSISHPPVRPPTLEAVAPRTEPSPLASTSHAPSIAAPSTTNENPHPRTNDISFDEASGFMVVRTIDVDTGEIVGQNPTEAYLRLAQAMTATTRVDADKKSGVVA